MRYDWYITSRKRVNFIVFRNSASVENIVGKFQKKFIGYSFFLRNHINGTDTVKN